MADISKGKATKNELNLERKKAYMFRQVTSLCALEIYLLTFTYLDHTLIYPWVKKRTGRFLVTSPNVDRFSQFFHRLTDQRLCKEMITKDYFMTMIDGLYSSSQAWPSDQRRLVIVSLLAWLEWVYGWIKHCGQSGKIKDIIYSTT